MIIKYNGLNVWFICIGIIHIFQPELHDIPFIMAKKDCESYLILIFLNNLNLPISTLLIELREDFCSISLLISLSCLEMDRYLFKDFI